MRAAVASMMLVIAVALLSSCATIRSLTPGQDSFQEGMALFNQGHFDSAVEQFRRSTRENPQSAQAYLYLGRSYISLGRWKSAIQPLRTAFRLSPYEARDEIMNLIIDAVFAAATNDPRLGEGGWSRDRYKDSL
jgi:cytochrome c-type biogenesis protein CcmH/NrfG